MKTISEFKKSAKELIRVSLGIYKGREICDIRCHYEAQPGLWKPTTKGITFSVALLPEIIEALTKAQSEEVT